MISEKQNRKLSSAICSRLRGKKICLCSSNDKMQELMKQSLNDINSQNQLELQILTMREIQDGGSVNLAVVTAHIQGNGSECLKQLDEQLEELIKIRESRPESLVYVSDSCVYGKSFGPLVSCREEEMGYVCHTSLEEMNRQCMRMAEHMVCRMAKEENMPVKVIRINRNADAEEMRMMMPYILGILLNGSSGEIYNVSADLQEQEIRETAEDENSPLVWKENRSPLTAMEIRLNTEKVRNYVASELFE